MAACSGLESTGGPDENLQEASELLENKALDGGAAREPEPDGPGEPAFPPDVLAQLTELRKQFLETCVEVDASGRVREKMPVPAECTAIIEQYRTLSAPHLPAPATPPDPGEERRR